MKGGLKIKTMGNLNYLPKEKTIGGTNNLFKEKVIGTVGC